MHILILTPARDANRSKPKFSTGGPKIQYLDANRNKSTEVHGRGANQIRAFLGGWEPSWMGTCTVISEGPATWTGDRGLKLLLGTFFTFGDALRCRAGTMRERNNLRTKVVFGSKYKCLEMQKFSTSRSALS